LPVEGKKGNYFNRQTKKGRGRRATFVGGEGEVRPRYNRKKTANCAYLQNPWGKKGKKKFPFFRSKMGGKAGDFYLYWIKKKKRGRSCRFSFRLMPFQQPPPPPTHSIAAKEKKKEDGLLITAASS